MPAPIIPFDERRNDYPPTFEVGDIIWRCDPPEVGHRGRDRFLVRSIAPFGDGNEVRASRIGPDGVAREDTYGFWTRYYDPVEGANYTPPKPPPTNHKIGVPKNKLP